MQVWPKTGERTLIVYYDSNYPEPWGRDTELKMIRTDGVGNSRRTVYDLVYDLFMIHTTRSSMVYPPRHERSYSMEIALMLTWKAAQTMSDMLCYRYI